MDKNSDDKIWEDLEAFIFQTTDEDDLVVVDETNNNKKPDDSVIIPNNNNDLLSSVIIDFNPEIYYEMVYSYNELPDNNIDYSNESFCWCCKNQLVIPCTEIDNFVITYSNVNKKKFNKYLLLIFRLCPKLLPFNFIMTNKILRENVYSYLNLYDNFKYNINERTDADISTDYTIYSTYITQINRNISPFVYEIYFYQPSLKYEDYIKCSICHRYQCPMHMYLSNCTFSKCTFCDKKWQVCGWCKPIYNEYYACMFIHKK
jgi:hypothetical protein